MKKTPKPITKKEEVKQNPDKRIDQDYTGYPGGPARDDTINPQTKEEEDIADIDNKDGEKGVYKRDKSNKGESDG